MSGGEKNPCNILADGVQLFGAPEKVGPFNHYKSFAVKTQEGKNIEFSINKIYSVRTLGKVGLACLKMIFRNEKSKKCFARFVLHQFPEDTKQGRINWQHGEDELMTYSQSITIRCCRILSWTTPEPRGFTPEPRGFTPKPRGFTPGTMPFKSGDMEEHKNEQMSLVRLRKKQNGEGYGKYSAFAGNAKLSKEVGFDVVRAKYITDVTNNAENQPVKLAPSGLQKQEGLQQAKQASVLKAKAQVMKKQKKEDLRGTADMDKRPSGAQKMQSGGTPNTTCTNEDAEKGTKLDCKHLKGKGGKSDEKQTYGRPTRSCRSIYGSCRKRKHEKSIEEACEEASKTKRVKKEATLSSQRKRENEQVSSDVPYEGESECKIKILSYDDYLIFRKCKKGLMAGLVMRKEEAVKKGVLKADSNNHRVLFTRTSFSEKDIQRCLLFEKTVERKCLFGKKRRSSSTQSSSLWKSKRKETNEVDECKEDNWKKESEEMYFASVGYKKTKDCKYMRYKAPCMKD